jgi:hypothetical protein
VFLNLLLFDVVAISSQYNAGLQPLIAMAHLILRHGPGCGEL